MLLSSLYAVQKRSAFDYRLLALLYKFLEIDQRLRELLQAHLELFGFLLLLGDALNKVQFRIVHDKNHL